MAGEVPTDLNLRDYEEQLNTLNSDDIRVPNQSLILDYFCTDHELTDFLRDEVFLESSIRHTTWKKVNQRADNESKKIIDDEISLLLDSGNYFSSRVWTDIVRLTATRQAHQQIVEYIDWASSYEQSINSGYEQWSLEPVREPKAETSARNTEDINNKPGAQILSNADRISQMWQQSRDSVSARTADHRLPILIGSFALLGYMLYLVNSVGKYETTSPIQENTSSIPTASDTSVAVRRLSDLEAQQKSAVLICEHKPIIDQAKSLSLVEPQNISRRDALIASSNKEIEFLDQKSGIGFKYWEDPSCTWGHQWFDNQADNAFRLFLAVTRKCSNPTVNYMYTKDQEGKALLWRGKYNAYSHTKGEIQIPYPPEPGEEYIHIENITCS